MLINFILIPGSVIGVLKAEDPENDAVEFGIEGEIANSILELESTGPYSANVTLKKELDREVRPERQNVIGDETSCS